MRTLFSSIAALALLAGCGTAGPAAGSSSDALAGPTWRLVALGGDAIPADAGLTLAFGADGRVSGSGGCNQFGGQAEVGADGALAFSNLLSTLRACAPPAGAYESDYLSALQNATRVVAADGELRLDGPVLLRFVATETAALTGTVTYLQRIALSPDAVVTVRLLDVSLADAPSVTLAEHTIPSEGRQVPIPYSLTYDPASIDARHRYVVRAEIRGADGALRWTTDTAFPVLTQGAPADGVEVRVVQVDG